ncbi:MAG: leucine-rich repeat domain-containing protein [Clostridiales bacterium]|nr:leucine-rich repeat domain-containing protein [Clostridiales bacterium]
MEKKITVNKKVGLFFVALITALCVIIGAVFGVSAYSLESGKTLIAGAVNASANGEGGRVTMLDLVARYPIDYVLGPIDVVDVNNDGKIDRNDINRSTGKFTYKSTNYVKDADGNPVKDADGNNILTNNTYGIPADQYYDVESYIYTTGTKDSAEGRTLYGWKPGIRGEYYLDQDDDYKFKPTIAENGEIMRGPLGDTASPIGIYVRFGNLEYGSTMKYAIIVPKDITTVGAGSAAFVDENNISYYRKTSKVAEEIPNDADYTDFGCFIISNLPKGSAPYFWQPRERLAGVYFPDDSRLKTIVGGTKAAADAAASSNQSTTSYKGKSAFQRCDNLRFMILPSGLESIGDYAFNQCSQIVDINIPSTVKSIGTKAFNNCSSVLHLSIPNNADLQGNIAADAFNDCTKLKDVDNQLSGYTSSSFPSTNSALYVFGGAPEDGVLDNGRSGFLFTRNGDKWSATSFAGETGESSKKVFVFPASDDFSADSDRRRGVKYDYLDCDGNKIKNTFSSSVTNYEYDIAPGFAESTWCRNAIIPEACKTIGEKAFYDSHIAYLETYATTIGASAFAEKASINGQMWLYFHKTKTGGSYVTTNYSIASNAFNNNTPGHVVFEDYDLYTAVTTNKPSNLPLPSNNVHYMIPVVANVYNDDDEEFTLKEGDMDSRFFIDSDYVKNPTIKHGNNSITYTKKLCLGSYSYDYVKQSTGNWDINAAVASSQSIPTLSNMDSTVWYTDTNYNVFTTAAAQYSISKTTSINLYTKNIAKPQNIYDKTYDGTYQGQFAFGETYTFGEVSKTLGDNDAECIDYNTALGLSTDYTVNLEKFTYANGVAGRTDNTSSLHNAGEYEFSIELNSKWGVWSDKFIADNAGYFDASVSIARKQLDFSTVDRVPLFVYANNDMVLNGDRTPIYKYNDGWYIAQKDGETPNDTKTVTNSFAYYTGNEVSIKIQNEVVNADGSSVWQDVNITSRNGLSFANSSEYTASFVFQVKYIPDTNNQYSNYIFYYGDEEETKYDNVTDADRGLNITGKQDTLFRISKRWYIVNQTNMFVNAGTDTPYLPIEGDVHYADDITVKVPALLYGNAAGKIEYAIDYVPVTGGRATTIAERPAEGATQNAISYYINSSMPAGTYNLKLYGSKVDVNVDDEIKSYSAISGEYTITVLPKEFDSETVADIQDTMRGNQVANPSQSATELEKYINAYPLDNKKLHESIATYITALNDTLVADRGNATNYWSDKDVYFDTAVTVGYNREGSGNTVYWNESDTLGALGTANTYTFYYSISAKNYESVGGADAADRQARGFRTTLYTAMMLSEIHDTIVDVTNPYFKNVTYTGADAKTSVPYSRYYSYSFEDTDYVNVGKRTVTLTLNDPDLARWESDGTDYSQYFQVVNDGKSLRVNFNIVTADNGWSVMPQMSSWTFNGFNKSVNAITAGLKFDSTVKYALIPNTVSDPLAVEWGSAVDGVAYFTVDENGMVDNAAAAKLNALKPASYYLKFFVSEIYAPDEETVNVYALEDIARNNINAFMATVTIGKAVNRWTSTPNVMRWTFGDYNSNNNLITAEALYPALLPKDENGNNIDGFAYTKDGAALTTAQSKFKFTVYDSTGADVTDKLASLHAGTYTLATSMDESDYYTAIAETRMSFEIAQAVNIWTTTPQVVQWTWGEYSASKNIISAETKFSGGDGSANSTDKPILFSVLQTVNGERVVVAGLENFQIDTNGNITNAAAAEAFAKLNAGNYYLRATKQGNNDYTDITGDATTDISFTVALAANSWDTQPVITGFVYKQFDAANNFIAGVPHFPIADKSVYYAIGTAPYANVTTIEDFETVAGTHFTLTDDDSVDAICTYIGGLTKRTYYFAVFVPADNNYSYLFYTGSFNVSQTNNYWQNATPPDIDSWTYGTFSASKLTDGKPIHGSTKYTVRYIVDGNVDETDSGIAKIGNVELKDMSYDELKAALENLNAGTYSLQATSGSTEDYAEAKASKQFTVAKANNEWTVAPSIIGWTYGEVPSAPNNGKVLHEATITGKYYLTKTDGNGNLVADMDNEVTTVENAGSYAYVVTVAETTNYNGFTTTLLFIVEKAVNTWTNTLSDKSWTWGTPVSITSESLAAADFGNDRIVYTISGSNINTITVKTSDGNVITALSSAINSLLPGTYTIVASIDSTDMYTAPTEVNFALLTINKVNVVWSEATESAVKEHNWVLNSESNSTLVQPTLGNAGDCTVTYTLVKVGSAGTLYSGSVWSGTNSLMAVLATQKAGSYEITATASGNSNYILPADVMYILTISAEPNDWKIKPAATLTWTYKGDDNTSVVFEPLHNKDGMIITVGGTELRYDRLMEQLLYLGVGSYSIVAYVPATEEYAAIEPYTVTLTISQASDAFGECNVPTSWDWDDVSQKTDENGVAWQTTWNTSLQVPVPQVSDIATAIVYSGTTEQFVATLHYYTVDNVKKVLETDLNALKSKLLGLHVGTYTIKFTVANSANYDGCSVEKTFNVLKVDNSWDGSAGVPTIAGWQYNSSVANPTATPVFGKGTVKFSYAKAVGSETEADLMNNDSILTWKDSTETTGGTYWLRAYVPGTDDYNALVGYHQFNINASQNGWVNNPGVIAWDWAGYDKAVNLFSGSAKNNGTATFKIYYGVSSNNRNLALSDFAANGVTLDKDEAWIISLFCTTGFTLVNDNNVMVVSDDVAKYLNALKPGTYLLSVNIAGDNNYAALSGQATFVVKQTANGWRENKAPAVSSYTYGNFGNSTYFTAGETVYGAKEAVTYRLEGIEYDGTTVSETFVSSESKGAYVKLQERLATLDAGTYTLSAWVAGSSNGTYSALYSSGSPYTTRSFTVARATNSWKNTELVTQINKAYSEIHDTAFDDTAFKTLYAELLHYNPDATVNYALLNSDYTSRNTDSLTYAQLFDEIKAAPAGEYVIRATVAQTNNYLAIAPTDTRLTISTHGNSFTALPATLTAQWARDAAKKNATVLTDFEVKAAYGVDTVTYTLGTATYNTYAEFKAAVSALNAGPYNVTISIAGTDEYVGLSEVRMLTVNPADNNWQNGWSVGGSLSVADVTTRAGLSWGWKSTVAWTRAVPLYGETVHVEIRQWLTATKEWYTVQYVTVDYSASNGDSAVAIISDAISKLDVGKYEIVVSAPASGNWTAISDKTEFEVTRVANSWVKAPYITGATANKWTYGATVIPGAESKYGAVRYEYATKSGGKLTAMPTAAGEYVIKFIVDGSNNYDGIDDSIAVKIEKANNRNFSVALGAIGWTWGAYDRESNLFKGTPEITDLENAPIKFSVGKGTGDDFAVLPDLSMFTLTSNGLVERDSKVEAALRALTGGSSEQNNTTQYTLRIHVGETDNYNGFTFDSTFVVTGATNTWTKTPSIVTWAVNNWTSESLPSAAALYGAPAITITGEADGVVYFKGAYKKVEGQDELELVVELNNLNLAPAGYYEMITTVGTVTGQYNIPLTANSRFRIDVKGAGEANYWEVIPNIDGWVANIDGIFNSPLGKPIRGLPNFVFYVRNEDGSRGQKVDASLTNLVVQKGDKYEADIYIPVEPGSYIMVASTNGNPASEGKPDALKEEEIYFTIGKRPLSFEEELRISTLLYLGERNDWANPTVKPSLDDAEITYVYTNKETGVSSTEMPTEAGIYSVTATLSAKYSQSISMSVDFTVKLSPNSWTAAPNIKDWSEEYKGNLPNGAATVGSDQIVYTYANVKEPNKILTERPTTEGSYIMYADVNVEGYEPLHAEYRFTIEPAFDRQLVTAAIVLMVIAAILAGVVIYFAIKRYKEN